MYMFLCRFTASKTAPYNLSFYKFEPQLMSWAIHQIADDKN